MPKDYPRSPQNLDHTKLWDEGCVNSRLKELQNEFIHELLDADRRAREEERFKKSLMLKQPIPREPFSMSQGQIIQVYGDKALNMAKEILEEERKAFVEYHAERFKSIIEVTIERLKPLVYTIDEEGKATKVTCYTEEVLKHDNKGDVHKTDIMYIEKGNVELLHQITSQQTVLNRLKDYVPYMPNALKKLYQDALDLATIKYVRKEKEKKKA